MSKNKLYEIRDPIHGFIVLNEWEREIINHSVFQRLRRIRQLALTDMVYPGANYSRFEHSLGVMHVATRMFDEIKKKNERLLIDKLDYDSDGHGLTKDTRIVRLAGLLHDVGHAPFSHAGEELLPFKNDHSIYKHEDYSAAAIEMLMKDVIEEHPINQNFGITAKDVADFIRGEPSIGRRLLWRNIIDSQLDADRADYLKRDSYHIGVEYGKYDLDRILVTLTLAFDQDGEAKLALEKGGEHAAEGLIVARYMMFTQVYFHTVRRAYDNHLTQALTSIISDWQRESGFKEITGKLPPPDSEENLRKYLEWTDWKVLGLLENGGGGLHGDIIRKRNHFRCVEETRERPTKEEIDNIEQKIELLKSGNQTFFVDKAENAWYKFGDNDLLILERVGEIDQQITKLSDISSVVNGLKPVHSIRIYVPKEEKNEVKGRYFS